MRRPRLAALAVLAAVALAAGSCGDTAAPACDLILFGRPGPSTGLGADRCAPRCTCGDVDFEPPTYTAADVAALRAWALLDPPPPLTDDPYAAPPPPVGDDAVCAVVREPVARQYRLRDYPTQAAALADGAVPTHFGVCGRCSPLADLAVYMEQGDLTAPVRACGLAFPSGPAADHVQCLRDLGFTEPCAQIWYYNTVHTRAACLAPCFAALDQPYHLPDGSLNECLRCDEVNSGPVFKAIAGRTRRNTGLPSALCRPCSEVRPLIHAY
ncbi:MAG: hypothetical protein IPL61_39435 [Myxococcales bacterium]|nr:hypothetical protein [Myxococcales bacterium]